MANYIPQTEIEKETLRLIHEAETRGIILRLLGGLAVRFRCPRSIILTPGRVYNDMDWVTDQAGGKKLCELFTEVGYSEDRSVNLLNGDRRQLYYCDEDRWQVDVFVGDFQMCHKIPVGKRLGLDEFTLPLAELFLTKAQIVELNEKDASDLLTLIWDHEVGSTDGEYINGHVIADLCSRDWGLYTTILQNLEKLPGVLLGLPVKTPVEESRVMLDRLDKLKEMIMAAPKSQAWKMRAVVGKRMRWYEEVEEVNR